MSWRGLLELQGVWQGAPAPADVGFYSLLELQGVWVQGLAIPQPEGGPSDRLYKRRRKEEEELLILIAAARYYGLIR